MEGERQMLSEKIKALRKKTQLSQEQLAEKLGVSRQAVTKWETGCGTPSIENLRALAALFCISMDALLENGAAAPAKQDFLFNSVTEYDIDSPKRYDITFAGANQVILSSYAGEKLQVRLASNQIAEIQSAFKVKIDDVKEKIDVDVRRFGDMSEAKAKESLCICFRFPQKYIKKIELSGNLKRLTLREMEAEAIEFSGKAEQVLLQDVSGWVSLDNNEDMEIRCNCLHGRLDVNQISSTSRVSLPADTPFQAVSRGIATRIFFEKDGKPTTDFSLQGEAAKACVNRIELNGLKSELIVNAISALPLEVARESMRPNSNA